MTLSVEALWSVVNVIWISKEQYLDSHINTLNMKSGPFKCNICSKNFTMENYLKNPIDSKYVETPKRSFEFHFFTAVTITRIVRNLKNTSATGVDGIPREILKKVLVS